MTPFTGSSADAGNRVDAKVETKTETKPVNNASSATRSLCHDDYGPFVCNNDFGVCGWH